MEQRSYWYMQGEYEHDESRSDAVDDEAYVSALIGATTRLTIPFP
jgi:hypothetical protein